MIRQFGHTKRTRGSFLVPFLTIIFYLSSTCVVASVKEECDNPDAVRVVSAEELASNIGKDGGPIWLAIFGEVYDVTAGPEYYAEGNSYSFFAGRDGSVPFVTGVFTDEEGQKGTEALTPAQLKLLDEEWRQFYEKEEKYPFVGLLEGRFYEKDGTPTAELLEAKEKIKSFVPKKPKARKAKSKKKTAKKPRKKRASKAKNKKRKSRSA